MKKFSIALIYLGLIAGITVNTFLASYYRSTFAAAMAITLAVFLFLAHLHLDEKEEEKS